MNLETIKKKMVWKQTEDGTSITMPSVEEIAWLIAEVEHLTDETERVCSAEDDAKCDKLVSEGHTEHCAARQIWGDGECECQKEGIVPGLVSKMIMDQV